MSLVPSAKPQVAAMLTRVSMPAGRLLKSWHVRAEMPLSKQALALHECLLLDVVLPETCRNKTIQNHPEPLFSVTMAQTEFRSEHDVSIFLSSLVMSWSGPLTWIRRIRNNSNERDLCRSQKFKATFLASPL